MEWSTQVVQNIPPPIPLDTPMVLIKPPEECSTVDVYKVRSLYVFAYAFTGHSLPVAVNESGSHHHVRIRTVFAVI